MNINDKEKIRVSYLEPNLPESVKALKPAVYQDAQFYYCVYGEGACSVVGRGATMIQAMQDWDQQFQKKKGG